MSSQKSVETYTLGEYLFKKTKNIALKLSMEENQKKMISGLGTLNWDN